MALILVIHNDGTGTEDSANYDWHAYVNRREIASGYAFGHNRADSWDTLVRLVVDSVPKREP